MGGIAPADLPQQETPIDAPPETIAVSEAERYDKLWQLAYDMGCLSPVGLYIESCQALLKEMARARGNAERAIAALFADPSLLRALPWLAGGVGVVGLARLGVRLGVKFGPAVIVAISKLGPKAAEVALNLALRAVAKGMGLDGERLASCLRKVAETVADPSGRAAAEAIGRCVHAAVSRK